ncbi:MAG TPA: cation transporter [Thermodesulfobacteriota bacterium]
MPAARRGTGIIYAAMGANLAIAAAKFAAYGASGSAALLSEGFHSVADTFNQVFLLLGVYLQHRPPTEEHPFGFGRERFFWSFCAAIFIFVGGAVASLYEGIQRWGHQPSAVAESHFWAYLTLAAAFLFELASWAVAVREIRHVAREERWGFLETVKRSKDPTIKTVLYEDSVALTGVVVAAVGIWLSERTSEPRFDAAGSIVIGALLAIMAFVLAAQTRSLLLGEAASAEDRARIRRAIERTPGIERVVEVLTVHIAPEQVIVSGHVVMAPSLSGLDVARRIEAAETAVRAAVPEVSKIFLEAEVPGRRE